MISGENVSHGNYEETNTGIGRDGLLLKKRIDLAYTHVILVDLIQSCIGIPVYPSSEFVSLCTLRPRWTRFQIITKP